MPRDRRGAIFAPRESVLVRPRQHLKVTALSQCIARIVIPRAAVLAGPFQHLVV